MVLNVVTTAHSRDDVRVWNKIAKSLLEKGVRINWIGPDLFMFENQEIDVHTNLTSYVYEVRKGMFARFTHWFMTFRAVYKVPKADFYYAPDPDAAMLLLLFSNFSRIRIIFDIHEVYHKDLLKRKIPQIFAPVLSVFLHWVIRIISKKVDLLVAVSETVLDYYKGSRMDGIIVRSCAPASLMEMELAKDKFEKFTIMHGKNHLARGTAIVIESCNYLQEFKGQLQFYMIDMYGILQGNRHEELEKLITANGAEEFVKLVPGMSFAQMQTEMSKCHAGLISYGRDLGIDSLPNRLFEYMAAGIPVLAPDYAIEISKIVEAEKCGVLTDTENPQVLAETIKTLMHDKNAALSMGQKGRTAFIARHNWDAEFDKLMLKMTTK